MALEEFHDFEHEESWQPHNHKEAALTRYQVKTDTGQIIAITAADEHTAAVRAADLYQVTVVAVRESQEPIIRVGIPEEARP
jgi:hypothetical protein